MYEMNLCLRPKTCIFEKWIPEDFWGLISRKCMFLVWDKYSFYTFIKYQHQHQDLRKSQLGNWIVLLSWDQFVLTGSWDLHNIKYHLYYHITNIMKQQHLNLSDENAIQNNPDNSYMHASSYFWSLELSKLKSHRFIKYACHSFITSVPFILLWILSSDISSHFYSYS